MNIFGIGLFSPTYKTGDSVVVIRERCFAVRGRVRKTTFSWTYLKYRYLIEPLDSNVIVGAWSYDLAKG